ncbi:HvfC/BufC family peptide modification chaperone, partial [Aeromonas veronii]
MNHTTLQRRFAARIRDPQQALPPGIATERMAIYEELFFNNLDGFIRSGFPVLRQLFDEPRWHRLVRAFMREHRCRTPYF